MTPPTQEPDSADAESRGSDAESDKPSPADALKGIASRLAELREYVNHYLSAKADGYKVALRNIVILAAIGVVALLAFAAFVATAVVLACVGVAHGLGALLGGRAWAGNLIAGLLFLSLIAGGAFIGMKVLGKSSRNRMVKKYAARQQEQRTRFGADAGQRAQESDE